MEPPGMALQTVVADLVVPTRGCILLDGASKHFRDATDTNNQYSVR
jgi:hypothetical protein